MARVVVVIERDEDGCYVWCPELKGCQSQGSTVEEAIANIREAAELYLETFPNEERLTSPGCEKPRGRVIGAVSWLVRALTVAAQKGATACLCCGCWDRGMEHCFERDEAEGRATTPVIDLAEALV